MSKRTKDKLSRLEKVAYHEAGHAVACFFAKKPYKHVTIEPGEDSYGHIRHFPLPDSFQPDIDSESYRMQKRIEQEIILLYSGHAAEVLAAGRHNWRGASDDTRRAVDLALYVNGDPKQTSAYLQWAWLKTMNFLKLPFRWVAVEGLAKALLERNNINKKEAKKIITTSIEDYVRQTKKYQQVSSA